MCGIVGYLGPSKAAPILLSELRCLEYRGYDSAGIAIIEDEHLCVVKAAGKLSNLENKLREQQPKATVGIGHTRWASHGEPTDENAHPHTDCTGTIAVVHNGIIENFQPLRDELMGRGHHFVSDTDTEVLAHLIEEEYRATKGDMVKALSIVVSKIEGAYAIGVINQKIPGKLYAVNGHYSLAVGLKDDESYLASDSVAVRQYTNKVLRIGQGEIAEISATGACLFSFSGDKVERRPLLLDANPFVLSKDGFKHFLLKEIHEQPLVMRQTLSKYLDHRTRRIDFNIAAGSDSAYGINLTPEQIAGIRRIQILACGTAYHAGMIGKFIIEDLAGIPVEAQIASETRGRKYLADANTLTIAVSQSGETADTLAAVTAARNEKSLILAITNRPDSHLAQISPNLIITECGVEVSVAATKTFVAQLASFYLFGIWLAEQRKTIDPERADLLKKTLLLTPALQDTIIAYEDEIREKSIKYSEAHDFVFMGRGYNYPVALEGALKLKELSYIHASGYAAGELKHGPIAVLDASVPVVNILIPGPVYEKALSNAQESKARNAKMIAVALETDKEVEKLFETVFRIPQIDEFFSPLLTVVPLQLMSYFIADYMGKDVDQPRNLAKSVTIE